MKLVWLIIPLVLFGIVGMSDSFGQAAQWSVQFGSDSFEGGRSISVDSSGNVYVTGTTSGSLFDVIAGESDAFVVKYDTDGKQVWAKQFDSIHREWGNGVTLDPSGNVYVTGTTSGSLFDTLIGEYDAFVIKYDSQGVPLQPSLKHQIKNIIPIDDITCKNESHLLVERTNEKLACVYLNTAEKLDWKSTDSDIIVLGQSVKESLLMRYQDMPEVMAFYAKYNDAQVSVRDDHVSYFAGSDDASLMRMNIFFDKNHALDRVDLHCYLQKVHQFEISQEGIVNKLKNYDCEKSGT